MVDLIQILDCPIIPVKDKRPLIEWGRWINEGQTSEERLEILEFVKSNQSDIAVVCGHETERGYFFCIDFDLPYEQVLQKLKSNKNLFTYLEKTPRGGLHAYYFSRRPVPSLKFKDVPLELKGRGSLIIVAPSKGYVALNDNLPKIVEDALQPFIEFAEELGYDIHDYFVEESRETEVDKSVLNEWLDAIVKELQRRGLNPRRGPNYYSCLCPFHPEKNPSFAINHRRFYAVDYHDGRIYKLLDLAKMLGLELVTEYGEEEVREKRVKTEDVVGGEVIGDCLVEVVAGPKLLLYYPADNKTIIAEEFRHGDVIYRPYRDLPFQLPDAPKSVGPDSSLWAETKEFIKSYFDNLDERVYDLMTAAVAWSYFYRDIKASTPYILFLGPWRSGKTRALEVLESICYRAVRVVDPSEASLFRSIELFRPTLLIDESQIIDQNVRAVMASGYRSGAKVMRVFDPEAEGLNGIRFYDTFAFIIYASREEPPSDIFSRSIIIHCEKNLRPTLKRIDEARALDLRTRWLSQRLYYFGKVRISFDEFDSDDGRLQELFSPLIVMAKIFGNNGAAEAIESYGRQVERELRDYESSTPEAELVEAVARIVEEREGDAPEVVLTSEILEHLNNGEWTAQRIGRRMGSLGFKRYHGPDGKRGYIIDFGLLERLKLRYGLSQPTLTTI